MDNSIPLSWKILKGFWSKWQVLRFHLSRPQKIKPPKLNNGKLAVSTFKSLHSDMPMEKVVVYKKLPKEEADPGMRIVVAIGLFFNRFLPQMKLGLPQIDADIHQALTFGLSASYRKAFRAPVMPHHFKTSAVPELENLAVQSPYAVFLERNPDGILQWDFRILGEFEHQVGLRSLGLRVVFTESAETKTLIASEIHSQEYGVVQRDSADWEASKLLAICAATTHLALTRHFNYVHLITGNHWDVASRNNLPAEHPLYRLIWPHIFNSLYTNHGVTRVQMLPDGDFVSMFSFTHHGLMTYFDVMYEGYDIAVTDPQADWQRRGLAEEAFDSPSQDNLLDLFNLMHHHSKRYIDAYYDSDEQLQEDKAVIAWLSELDGLIPNGLKLNFNSGLTRDALARAVAAYIYEGNTMHDMAGTTLWDYQLWADRNPTRIYKNGLRVPVDSFQRVINNNFALQLRRAPLLDDYGQVALDAKGAKLFSEFSQEAKALQEKYDRVGGQDPWRMEPKNLEISMNG